MASWLDFGISNPFSVPRHDGIDVPTPLDTPITSLLAGTVLAAGYHAWGGEVDVMSPSGLGTDVIHLDIIDPGIVPGAQVGVGTELGLSGGQLSGGSHPAVAPFSSGPHTHLGFFTGTLAPGASSADQNPSLRYVDPASVIAGLTPSDVLLLSAQSDSAAAAKGRGLTPPDQQLNPIAGLQAASQIPAAIAGIPTTIGHGIADAFGVGVHDAGVFLQRQVIAFFVAALVLLVLFKL